MIPVLQRGRHDCLRAALASIFECDYEETPVLVHPETGRPLPGNPFSMVKWARDRGYLYEWHNVASEVSAPRLDPSVLRDWEEHWIGSFAVGLPFRPGSGNTHARVMYTDQVSFDPGGEASAPFVDLVTATRFVPLHGRDPL
jgi:hypothetical protein